MAAGETPAPQSRNETLRQPVVCRDRARELIERTFETGRFNVFDPNILRGHQGGEQPSWLFWSPGF